MSEKPLITEDEIAERLRRRGLACDRDRAAALLAPATSLLARLARLAGQLPREAVPPPHGPLEDREP